MNDLLHRLLGPGVPELSCEQCFDDVSDVDEVASRRTGPATTAPSSSGPRWTSAAFIA